MIIAIFGRSSTGKTTIVRSLAQRFPDMPIRHCGEETRLLAKQKGLKIDDLTASDHQSIDVVTRAWVGLQDHCIVEGRYLASVLLGRSGVLFVRLEASENDRIARWQARHGTVINLGEADAAEDAFCDTQYPLARSVPTLTLNTSGLSVAECVQLIGDLIQIRVHGRD